MHNLLEPIKLSKCNLIQALEWIAFGYEPVRPEDEKLDGREIYRGTIIPNRFGFKKSAVSDEEKAYESAILCSVELFTKAIILGKITIYAQHISHYGYTDNSKQLKITELEDYNPEKVQLEFSDDLSKIYITIPSQNIYQPHAWCCDDLYFLVDELKKIFPQKRLKKQKIKSINNTLREYTTPYLDIIDELISEKFYKNPKLLVKKQLSFIISEKMKEKGVPKSNNIAEVMATILRPVELQRGGTHSPRK